MKCYVTILFAPYMSRAADYIILFPVTKDEAQFGARFCFLKNVVLNKFSLGEMQDKK